MKRVIVSQSPSSLSIPQPCHRWQQHADDYYFKWHFSLKMFVWRQLLSVVAAESAINSVLMLSSLSLSVVAAKSEIISVILSSESVDVILIFCMFGERKNRKLAFKAHSNITVIFRAIWREKPLQWPVKNTRYTVSVVIVVVSTRWYACVCAFESLSSKYMSADEHITILCIFILSWINFCLNQIYV